MHSHSCRAHQTTWPVICRAHQTTLPVICRAHQTTLPVSCRAHQTTLPVICYCSSLAWLSVFFLDVAQPAGQPDGGPGGRAVVHYGNCGNAWLVYIVRFCFRAVLQSCKVRICSRAVLQSSNITSVYVICFFPLYIGHMFGHVIIEWLPIDEWWPGRPNSALRRHVFVSWFLQRRADCEVLEATQDNCCRTYLLEDSAPRGCRVMTLTDANVVQR